MTPAVAIQNGATHASASTHWIGQAGCNNGKERIEVTADGKGLWGDTSGPAYPVRWTQQNPNTLLFAFDSTGSPPYNLLSDLKGIVGATSGSEFSALSLHLDGGNANCSYSLVSGSLSTN